MTNVPEMVHRSRSYQGLAASLLTLSLCAGGCAATPRARPVPRPAAPSATPPSLDPDTYSPRPIDRVTLLRQFTYDRSAPLHLRVLHSRTQDGATIQAVTYGADATPAEIVFPTKSHGQLPGIVYAHGGGPGPEAFLADALTMVKHGAVAIMPDIPITMTGIPSTDIAYVTGTVIAERRALDVLAARPDVDSHRLAFVGHSWGAEIADIMAGVEPRLSAVVIACGWSRMSTDMLSMGATVPAADYLDAATVLDGFRYVAIPGRRHILIQYGRQDPNIPQAQRTELTRAATGSVVRKDYDAGHDLVDDPTAAADRTACLVQMLR